MRVRLLLPRRGRVSAEEGSGLTLGVLVVHANWRPVPQSYEIAVQFYAKCSSIYQSRGFARVRRRHRHALAPQEFRGLLPRFHRTPAKYLGGNQKHRYLVQQGCELHSEQVRAAMSQSLVHPDPNV